MDPRKNKNQFELNKGGRLLTVFQVAEALGLKPSTIRKMILERRIDFVRPTSRAVRIPEGVVQWIIDQGYQEAIGVSSDSRN